VAIAADRLGRFDESSRSRLGVLRVFGVDEAGRGPLAGPVVAAAVLLPPGVSAELRGVRDSKQLSAQQRDVLFDRIRRHAIAVGVGWSSPEHIDAVNILQATFHAMRLALARAGAGGERDAILVDGDKSIPGVSFRQEPIIGGDDRSLAVASASIVAKVVRDRWMRRLDHRFPGYGFHQNKGYPTADHLSAVRRLGPSPVHRRSFRGAA
jgi:ribonuclease HII